MTEETLPERIRRIIAERVKSGEIAYKSEAQVLGAIGMSSGWLSERVKAALKNPSAGIGFDAAVGIADAIQVSLDELAGRSPDGSRDGLLESIRRRSEQLWSGKTLGGRRAELAVAELIQRGHHLAVAMKGAESAMAYEPPRNASEETVAVKHIVALAERMISATPSESAQAPASVSEEPGPSGPGGNFMGRALIIRETDHRPVPPKPDKPRGKRGGPSGVRK